MYTSGSRFSSPPRTHGDAFSLIELLVVAAIIGLLVVIGLSAFQTTRAIARDGKRVSDVRQVFVALEFYFENHGSYPADGVDGPGGIILGTGDALALSDAGFSAAVSGTPFMTAVPPNPEPGGFPYIYRSLAKDGADCVRSPCDAYAILFYLERRQGNLLAGAHAQTPQGIAGAEGGSVGAGVTTSEGDIIGVRSSVVLDADRIAAAVSNFSDDPAVKTAAGVAVAPAAAAAALANAAAAAHGFGAAWSVIGAALQPILLFGRKRRAAWGVVYDSLSHLPADLATVRLHDAATERVVASVVTDAEGRFSISAKKGSYVIDVVTTGKTFPSDLLASASADGQYADLYHGEVIRVDQDGTVLTPNIPVDPAESGVTAAAARKSRRWQDLHRSVALLSPCLGALAFVISPTLFVGLLFALQLAAFGLFRRLAVTPDPRNWGIIYEEGTRRPVSRATVRVFALPYNKLLETHVTDGSGRYHFRVGNGRYYVTVTGQGYLKTETEPLELQKKAGPSVIASDIPMRPEGAKGGQRKPPAVSAARTATVPPAVAIVQTVPPQPSAPQPGPFPAELPPAKSDEPGASKTVPPSSDSG